MMQVLLITSSNSDFIEGQINKYKEQLKITAYNYFRLDPSPSITIDAIRQIQKNVSLKPFGGGNRLIVITSINQSSTEAQNSLLKILEDTPNNTYFILTSSQINLVLPTIVSRCQVITQKSTGAKLPPNHQEIESFISEILSQSEGQRILSAQKLYQPKEAVIIYFNQIINYFEYQLYQEKNALSLSKKQLSELINKTANAKIYLERNINVKAIIDIYLLGFPKKYEKI